MKMFVFTNRISMLLLFVMLLGFMHSVYGFDCELGGSSSETFLDKVNPINPKSCPTLIDSSDKKFCCRDANTGISLCCTLQDFIGDNMMWVWITAGILALILIASVICCCRCCC